ncbi:MAG: hypothetical protein QM752_06030 [Gammaproteobacteria bacterium]
MSESKEAKLQPSAFKEIQRRLKDTNVALNGVPQKSTLDEKVQAYVGIWAEYLSIRKDLYQYMQQQPSNAKDIETQKAICDVFFNMNQCQIAHSQTTGRQIANTLIDEFFASSTSIFNSFKSIADHEKNALENNIWLFQYYYQFLFFLRLTTKYPPELQARTVIQLESLMKAREIADSQTGKQALVLIQEFAQKYPDHYHKIRSQGQSAAVPSSSSSSASSSSSSSFLSGPSSSSNSIEAIDLTSLPVDEKAITSSLVRRKRKQILIEQEEPSRIQYPNRTADPKSIQAGVLEMPAQRSKNVSLAMMFYDENLNVAIFPIKSKPSLGLRTIKLSISKLHSCTNPIDRDQQDKYYYQANRFHMILYDLNSYIKRGKFEKKVKFYPLSTFKDQAELDSCWENFMSDANFINTFDLTQIKPVISLKPKVSTAKVVSNPSSPPLDSPILVKSKEKTKPKTAKKRKKRKTSNTFESDSSGNPIAQSKTLAFEQIVKTMIDMLIKTGKGFELSDSVVRATIQTICMEQARPNSLELKQPQHRMRLAIPVRHSTLVARASTDTLPLAQGFFHLSHSSGSKILSSTSQPAVSPPSRLNFFSSAPIPSLTLNQATQVNSGGAPPEPTIVIDNSEDIPQPQASASTP